MSVDRSLDHRWGILVTVALGWFLALGLRLVLPAILPQLKAEFALSNSTAGAIISLVWLLYASSQFPGGLLTDRYGERPILLASVGVALFSISLFVGTTGFVAFVIACLLFGLGTGLFGPPRITILSKSFPGRDGMALGITFAAGSLGAATLPFLSGMLTPRFGWRSNFLLTAPLFLVVLIGGWLTIADTASEATDEMDFPDWNELLNGIRDTSVLFGSVAITLWIFVFQGLTSFLPLYLIQYKSVSQELAASIFALFFVTSGLVQPVSGHLSDHFSRRTILVTLAGVHALAILALIIVDDLTLLVLLMVVLGTRGGVGPINNAVIVDRLPYSVQGSGYGLLRTTYLILGATGSMFVGFLADFDLLPVAFVVLGGLSIVAAGCYYLIPSYEGVAERSSGDTS